MRPDITIHSAKRIELPIPKPGEHIQITGVDGAIIEFDFHPMLVRSRIRGDDLILEYPFGGSVTIVNFFDAENGPLVELPNKHIYNPREYLWLLDELGRAMESGLVLYTDDAGNLIPGVDRPGLQLTDYWGHSLELDILPISDEWLHRFPDARPKPPGPQVVIPPEPPEQPPFTPSESPTRQDGWNESFRSEVYEDEAFIGEGTVLAIEAHSSLETTQTPLNTDSSLEEQRQETGEDETPVQPKGVEVEASDASETGSETFSFKSLVIEDDPQFDDVDLFQAHERDLVDQDPEVLLAEHGITLDLFMDDSSDSVVFEESLNTAVVIVGEGVLPGTFMYEVSEFFYSLPTNSLQEPLAAPMSPIAGDLHEALSSDAAMEIALIHSGS